MRHRAPKRDAFVELELRFEPAELGFLLPFKARLFAAR
jgi:hypothetical protein